MLRNLNQSAGGQRILGVPQVGILAAQILAETATGDYGPGVLYNEAQQPEHAGKYLRARITNWPGTGTLRVEENGSYTASGLPDGVHVFGYDFYLDGVYQGAAGFTITVGVQAATAPGATITGSATLTPGAASGQQNATAPGATITGSASLAPGAATGASAGSAPGATLTGSATLTAGAASGQSNASAPGATLTGAATLTPGSATGGAAPTTGNFDSEIMVNNTGSLLASVAVLWEWRKGSGIGVAPTSVVYGSGTTSPAGVLTASGLPLGTGELLVATPDYASVYYQRGAVA